MKNLKRALAVLVVVTMMISTVAFASFSDVKDGTSVANAVNVGVGLNLFKGYEDGTFKAEGDITRAEFAAIVVRALGQEAQANGAKSATSFTDVKADHWAAGYINIVTRLGVVNGYGDGTFGPEDKVLYEQAIKMIVVALGYTPAIGAAGYPVGYLTKAGELGITSGVAGSNGVAANRGTVAQLVFNALDVPLMQQTGYGTNLDYVVQDGFNATTRKTLMSEYLDVVKLQVMVVSYEAVTSTTKNANDVKVNILNDYKTKYSEEFGKNTAGNYPTNYSLDAGTSGIGALVGTKAFAYVSYDDSSSDTPVVVFATKDTSKSDEITIKASDIETVTTAAGVTTVEYWANDTDKKTTKATYKQTATNVYENGVVNSSPTALTSVYGDVTFAKYNTSTTEDYDTVFITNYTNVVVDSISERNFKLSAKNASSISFDPDDSTVKSTLYDSKGVEMKWTDLKEWDVVSCKIINGTKKVTIGTLVGNKVTGKITEVETNTNTAKNKFTIDGKVYEIDSKIKNQLALEDEGIFFLDIMGNICYYDTTAALNTNYAYIFKTSYDSTSIDGRTEVKLFSKKGEFVTLKTASKVKLDGVSNIETATLKNDNKYTKTTTVTCTSATASSSVVTYDTKATNKAIGIVSTIANPVVYPYTIATTVYNSVDAGQFITYDVNSSNEITKIDRANIANLGKVDVKGVFAKYGSAQSVTRPVVPATVPATTVTTKESVYTEASKTLTTDYSKVFVTDKTVIMVAPANSIEEDDYELVNVASISDDQVYEDATFYNVNANREVGAVLVNKAVTVQSATTGIAAVTGSSSGTNTAGDTIVKIKAMQNGSATTLNGDVNFTNTYAVGTAIIPVLNIKGEVKSATVLAVPSDAANSVTFTATNSGKVVYYAGLVTERNTNTLTTSGGDITVPGTANVYIYDERSSSTNRITSGGVADFDAKLDSNTGVTTYDNNVSKVYAIAREYDGKIVDVMIYIFTGTAVN